MNAAPTICRACGQPMPHAGRHVCDKCDENEQWLVEEQQNTQYERPDDSDLTRLIWRLRGKPDRYWIAGEWFAMALGLSALGICIYWLMKQLL